MIVHPVQNRQSRMLVVLKVWQNGALAKRFFKLWISALFVKCIKQFIARDPLRLL